MDPIISTLNYWLVSHPKILHFSWNRGETLGSSLFFLISTVLGYLSFTAVLATVPHPTFAPKLLRPITAVHNVVLLSLSLIMAVGCTLSAFSIAPDIHYVICFPKNTRPTGPLFFWAYMFYLSKILEFMDTLLILMSSSIKRRLTFLHVYHHSTVVIMCYICLTTSQSSFPMVLVTNASVHLLMYSYYLLCCLGKRPKWKRLVTDCQILQFISSFAIMALIIYYHFSGLGCSGIWSWCFNAIFITSLLVLFLDFHYKVYSSEKKLKGT